jgi:lipopolysaccharide transport system ATP-binding protein
MLGELRESENLGEPSHNDEIILSVQNVSKKFCRKLKTSYTYGLRDIAKELMGLPRNSHRLRTGEFWALKDVNLEIKRGQSIGLVGVNGSGKTTLLKIINGLMKPDTGTIKLKGRVAALIALGAGFNPVLSGRENVYINMSILGLSLKEIQASYDKVLEFAEIGDAIEAPVRTYSSGMRARLGFACAIYTNPDLLLIDEVLAVGDFRFRTKCRNKLAQLRQNGVSFVLVSHSPSNILLNCESAAYLSKGNLVMVGDAKDVMKKYREDLSIAEPEKSLQQNASLQYSKTENSLIEDDQQVSLQIHYLSFKDERDNLLSSLNTSRPVYLEIEGEAYQELKDVSVNSIIKNTSLNENQCDLYIESSKDIGFFNLKAGRFKIRIFMPYCCLMLGEYALKLGITHNGEYYSILDGIESFRFVVTDEDNIGQSSFYQPRKWQIVEGDLEEKML